MEQPPRPRASFFAWHRKLVDDVAARRWVEGLDRIARQLDEAFGERPSEIAIAHLEKSVSAPRAAGALRYSGAGSAAGAPAIAASRASAAVPRNTFFGA